MPFISQEKVQKQERIARTRQDSLTRYCFYGLNFLGAILRVVTLGVIKKNTIL
jgi:hypothetical protein